MRLYAKRVMLFAGGGVDQWNLITLLWWLWLSMVWGQDSSCDRHQPISRCPTVTWSFQSMQGIALTISFIIQNEKHFSPNNKSANINQPVKETTLLMVFFYLFFSGPPPPKKGSIGLGTLLTITGTGFISENASIFVGKAKCHVEQISSKWLEFNNETSCSNS